MCFGKHASTNGLEQLQLSTTKSIPVLPGVDPLKCRTKFERCFFRDPSNAIVWPSCTNSSMQVQVHQHFLAPRAANRWSIHQSKCIRWGLSLKMSLFQRGTLCRNGSDLDGTHGRVYGADIFHISSRTCLSKSRKWKKRLKYTSIQPC